MEEKGCAYLVGARRRRRIREDLVTLCRTAAAVTQFLTRGRARARGVYGEREKKSRAVWLKIISSAAAQAVALINTIKGDNCYYMILIMWLLVLKKNRVASLFYNS